MPNVILDRIPLPNLRLYTSVSVMLVSCCIYYAITATSDPFWRLDNNTTVADSLFSLSADTTVGDNADNLLVNTNGAKESVESRLDPSANGQQQVASTVFQYISPDQRKLFNDTRTIGNKFKDVVSFMVQEPICIWVSAIMNSIKRLN